MKVAIIAIAKNENLYVNEWINYHLRMGFDNIIICDNDDELILPDVINNDKVIIEDYTKIYGVQQMAYRQTFKKYRNEFDWIFFIDIDEFFVLEKHKNVKEFLSTFPDNVECIKVSWKHFNDNEELDVIDGNYNVFGRFKTVVKTKYDNLIKAFVKTTINDKAVDRISQHSVYDNSVFSVNVLNNKCDFGRFVRNPIYEVAWINHYKTKTIGEFIRQKYFRGGPNRNNVITKKKSMVKKSPLSTLLDTKPLPR